jgi:K+-sensing histidine kinase KdpD
VQPGPELVDKTQRHSMLADIEDEADRLTRLVSDLLAMIRQVLVNLLENAATYGRDPLELRALRAGRRIELL